MKKTIVKLISVLIVCIMLCSFITLFASAANSTITETESNNSYSTANVVGENQTITANLSSSSDKDYFKFTPTKEGVLTVNFKHTYSDSSSYCWHVYVYKYTGSDYVSLTDNLIEYSDSENKNVVTVGISANETYFVKITNYSSSFPATAQYSVTCSFTARSDYEKEFNNSFSNANPVAANTPIYANLYNTSDDVDYFKFVSTQAGTLTVNFKHTYSNSSSYCWHVYVYKYTGSDYVSLTDNLIKYSDSENKNVVTVGISANETYFVKITNYSSSFPATAQYSVTCSFTGSGSSHTHSYGTAWKSDVNYHWHECTCGEISSKAPHTFDSGKVTKAATETETGVRTCKCIVCGYEKTETIPVINNSDTGDSSSDDSSSIFSVFVNIFGYIISFFVMIFQFIMGIFG